MSGTQTTSFTMTPTSGQTIPGSSQIVPSKYMFYGEIENIRGLIPVLKSICIKRTAVMAITERGLKITCENDTRTVQATAFIDRNLFIRYELRQASCSTPLTLCFRMSDMLNALSILFPSQNSNDSILYGQSSSSVMRIKYDSIDRLKLQVVCGDHSAMAYIQTFLPTKLEVYSMSFVNKVIMDASVLIDFWKSADVASLYLEIKLSSDPPFLEMATEGDRGRFVYRTVAHSIHIEHYECTVPVSNKYEMSALHSTLRPLLLASKVSIRIDSNGLLNMQFLVRLDSADLLSNPRHNPPGSILSTTQLPTISQEIQKCFIEYFIVPSLDST